MESFEKQKRDTRTSSLSRLLFHKITLLFRSYRNPSRNVFLQQAAKTSGTTLFLSLALSFRHLHSPTKRRQAFHAFIVIKCGITSRKFAAHAFFYMIAMEFNYLQNSLNWCEKLGAESKKSNSVLLNEQELIFTVILVPETFMLHHKKSIQNVIIFSP